MHTVAEWSVHSNQSRQKALQLNLNMSLHVSSLMQVAGTVSFRTSQYFL